MITKILSNRLRLGAITAVMAISCISSASPTAEANGFDNVYQLSWNYLNVSTGNETDGPYYYDNQGPDYHNGYAVAPADPSEPMTPLYASSAAMATGTSSAGIDVSSLIDYTLTNYGELPELAVLSFGCAISSFSNVDDLAHQFASNSERFGITDSANQLPAFVVKISTDTITPGDQNAFYDFSGTASYYLAPNSSLDVYLMVSSNSSSVSAIPMATPEPTSILALGLGALGIGLRRKAVAKRSANS